MTSLFIHTNPLSLVIEHKEQYSKNEIIEILSEISRDMDLVNSHMLGTILWITIYLFDKILSTQAKDLIDDIWKANRDAISEKYGGNWKVDSNLKIGSLKIVNDNGDEFEFERPQRK